MHCTQGPHKERGLDLNQEPPGYEPDALPVAPPRYENPYQMAPRKGIEPSSPGRQPGRITRCAPGHISGLKVTYLRSGG